MSSKHFWNSAPDGFGLSRIPTQIWQSGGVSRLLPIGEALRAEGLLLPRRALGQAVLYSGPGIEEEPASPWSPIQLAILSSLGEILHRSELCPLDPFVDRLLVESSGNPEWRVQIEYGRWTMEGLAEESAMEVLAGAPFHLGHPETPVDPIRRYEDEGNGQPSAERAFLLEVTRRWPALAHWLHPQILLSKLGSSSRDARRADFVLCPPLTEDERCPRGLVIEIHGVAKGEESRSLERSAQEKKRKDLASWGWEVLDVPRQDVLRKEGEWLQVLERWAGLLPTQPMPAPVRHLLDGGWIASSVDLSLWHLLGTGAWSITEPRVGLVVPAQFVPVARRAARAFLHLVRSIERVWQVGGADSLFPPGMEVQVEALGSDDAGGGLRVGIHPVYRAYWPTEERIGHRELQVWRCCLPFEVEPFVLPQADAETRDLIGQAIGQRPPLTQDPGALDRHLRPLLRRLFGKIGFREGQVLGIASAIAGVDRLILLPAGHGKSLIFQLAAFLLPGATLVVEPLRALLDDQIQGLQDHGISRVAGVHAERHLQGGLESQNIVYLAPERLYVPSFQQPLLDLIQRSGLDLLVVDEAHSVSECGHSFRPAYLGFRQRLLHLVSMCSKRRTPPSTLGLTATAVAAVVDDVRSLLEIQGKPVSLTESFSKKNLSVTVRNLYGDMAGARERRQASRVAEGKNSYRPLVRSMHSLLEEALQGIQPEEKTLVFCSSRGRWTSGRGGSATWYGVEGTVERVNTILGQSEATSSVFFHGRREMEDKAHAARAFSSGKATIMVATSAFGTGIDISDIRRVIHLGAPAGLEAWYQESGRAGRDGQDSEAILLLDLEGEGFMNALAEAEKTPDALPSLRAAVREEKRKGSFCRQMQLLLGDDPPDPGSVQLDQPLAGRFLGSFPGWLFEIKAYDRRILQLLFEESASPRGDGKVAFSFHQDHDALVWKAVHRLVQVKVIQPWYRRTYHRNRPNEFEIELAPDGFSLEPEDLADQLMARCIGLSGFGGKARLAKSLTAERETRSGIFSENAYTRALEACRKNAFLSYETVRVLRVGSFLSFFDFSRMEEDSKRRKYIDHYVRTSPGIARFVKAIREDVADRRDWAFWLDRVEEEYDWPELLGLLAQGSAAGVGSSLPDFLHLAVGFSRDEVAPTGDAVLRAVRLVRNDGIPDDTMEWALDRLHRVGGEVWLDLLDRILGKSDGVPGDYHPFLEKWTAQLPEDQGHRATAFWGIHRFLEGAWE